MTKDDRRMLILFLETFKQELLVMAETYKEGMIRRSDLDNVFAFKIASKENQSVVQEMVDEVVSVKGDNLETGYNNLEPVDANQLSNEGESKSVGRAKTYTSSHFRSDRDAA